MSMRARLWASLAGIVLVCSLLIPNPSAAHLSIIRQGAESAGSLESGDWTGRALAVGDFDGDGYDDLAIGAPTEDVGSIDAAGAVVVVFGTALGLTHEGALFLTATSLGFTSTEGAWFGFSIVSGNFNNDAYDDLVIGAPFHDEGLLDSAGRVYVAPGGPGGINTTFTQDDCAGDSEGSQEWFGQALAVGDFNGDAIDDLAIGSPGEGAGAGKVFQLLSSGAGLDLTTCASFTQTDLGGTALASDNFGLSLAAGQVTGGLTQDDLIVGAPFKDVAALGDAGMVYVIQGTPAGLSSSFVDIHTANDIAPLQARAAAHFGLALAVGKFSSNNFRSVAIGEPRRTENGNFGAGRVVVVDGGALDLDFANAMTLVQEDLMQQSEFGDDFGFALATGDFDNDGYEELAIGGPGEGNSDPSTSEAGRVFLLFGDESGLSLSGDKLYFQTDLGDIEELNDHLGTALAFGHFDNSGNANLAIGAPQEDTTDDVLWSSDGTHVEQFADAGSVYILAPWRQPEEPLRCRQSVAYDCSDELVFSQRPFDRVRIASTTKVMTALLTCEAIEAGDVDSTDVYTIPAWLADPSKVTGGRLGVLEDEMYTLWDMLHLSYGQSYNDITFGIADHVTAGADGWQGPGSATVGTFVDMMNDKAAALGMTNTLFTNPAGRPWEDPYSTPADMAKLMRAAIQNPVFRDLANDITWTTDYIDSNANPAKMTLNASFKSLDDAYKPANAYKPGGNNQSQRTGIFSARSNFLGTVVGTAFGWRRADPAEPQANRVEDMANLSKLAFTGCGQEVAPPPAPPGSVLNIANIPSDLGVQNAYGAPGEDADAEDLDVVLVRQSGEDAMSLHVEVRRSSVRNHEVGTSVSYGFGPVIEHDGFEVTNDGTAAASLSLTVSHPSNTFSVTLNPSDTFVVPSAMYSVPTALTLSIDNVGTATADLSVRELGYHADVSSSRGGFGDILFQQTLARGGPGSVDDVILIDLEGMDRVPGNLVSLLLQKPGLPTDAGELPLVASPARIILYPNEPNPFNPATTIRYSLVTPQRVDLRVFDATGRLVRILERRARDAGTHAIVWDGRSARGLDAASGVYFYVLRAGDTTRSRSMVLLR
jgi:D-alanyl-D-alanine carboxypeptidase